MKSFEFGLAFRGKDYFDEGGAMVHLSFISEFAYTMETGRDLELSARDGAALGFNFFNGYLEEYYVCTELCICERINDKQSFERAKIISMN